MLFIGALFTHLYFHDCSILALEHLKASDESVNDTIERALQSGLSTAEHYLTVLLVSCDYHRRRLQEAADVCASHNADSNEISTMKQGEALTHADIVVRLYKLRSCFDKAEEFLTSYYAEWVAGMMSVICYRVQVEDGLVNQVLSIVSDVTGPGPALRVDPEAPWDRLLELHGKYWYPWQECIHHSRARGDILRCRKLYQRAISIVTDNLQEVYLSWLQFEERCGTLLNLSEAEAKVRPRLQALQTKTTNAVEVKNDMIGQNTDHEDSKIKEKKKAKKSIKTHTRNDAYLFSTPNAVDMGNDSVQLSSLPISTESSYIQDTENITETTYSSSTTTSKGKPKKRVRFADVDEDTMKTADVTVEGMGTVSIEGIEDGQVKNNLDTNHENFSAKRLKTENGSNNDIIIEDATLKDTMDVNPEKNIENATDSNQNSYALFVKNISFKATENDIKSFFTIHSTLSNNEINDTIHKDEQMVVTPILVTVNRNSTGKSRGTAQIRYENSAAVTLALKLNGHELLGRPVVVEIFGESVTKQNTANENQSTKLDPYTIYLDGIMKNVVEDRIREIFGSCGDIEAVKLIKDLKTQKNKV